MTDIKKYSFLIIVSTIYYCLFFGSDFLCFNFQNSSYVIFLIVSLLGLAIYNIIYKGKAMALFINSKKYVVLKNIIYIFLLFGIVIQGVGILTYGAKSIGTVFMQKSPFQFILLFLFIPIAFGGYFGIKAISRYAYIAGIFIIGVIFSILLFGYKQYEFTNLFPIFSLSKINFKNIFIAFSIFSNIIFLLLLSAKDKCDFKSTRRELNKIILVCSILFALVLFCYNMTVSLYNSNNMNNPLFVISSVINLGFLLERSEAIIYILWLFAEFITGSMLLCFSKEILGLLLKISDKNAILPLLISILFSASLIFHRINLETELLIAGLIIVSICSIIIPIFSILTYKSQKLKKGDKT